MAVTTLRQMPHTEIDDSFKSDLLGGLESRYGHDIYICVCLTIIVIHLEHTCEQSCRM